MTVLQDQVLLSSAEFRAYQDFWQSLLTIKERPQLAGLPLDEGTHPSGDFSESFYQLSQTAFSAVQARTGQHKLAQFTFVLAALRLMMRDAAAPCVVRIPNFGDTSPNPANPWLYLVLPLDHHGSVKTMLNQTKNLLKQAVESAAYPLEQALEKQTLQLLAQTNVTVCMEGLGAQLTPQHPNDVVLHILPSTNGLQFKTSSLAPCRLQSWQDFMARLDHACAKLANPADLIQKLEPLPQALIERLLNTSLASPAMSPTRFETIAAYITDTAQTYPQSTAIWFEEEELSYAELEAQANKLAHHLRDTYEIAMGDFLGIFLKPSPRMVIAMLACLKLGAAYMPLDPDEPAERLDEKLDLTQPKLMLVDSEWMFDLEAPCGVFAMDLQLDDLPDCPQALPDISGLAPAYVIFTSGSSGKAKAVVVPQKGICALIEGQADAFQCGHGSRVVQFASFTFDASVSEIFVTLGSGATLYLAARNVLMPGPEMTAFFNQHAIDCATLPPAVLRVLSPEDFPHLKTLISAGEKCDAQTVTDWAKDRRFINAYGPTEASVCGSMALLTPDVSHDPPIGTPFAHQQVLLTDQANHLAAPGSAGEISLGGALAWGYLGQPGRTAQAFQPHPFSSEPGARLYKTGDVGQWDSENMLRYLGRRDFQVKIRGFRIELEEIERALLELDTVKNAAVKPAADGSSLHAYLVAEPSSLEIIEEFQRYQLPNGMAITHHQKGETDFIYGEVFEKQLYGTHHLTLKPGDCIFDVGANIGLFSLYAQQLCPGGSIFAFEPMPPNFQRLKINTGLYGPDVQVFNCGLGEMEADTQFAFYPKSTGASGRFTDQTEEEAVVRALIRNQEAEDGGHADDDQVEELVDGMFEKELYDVELRRLSDIIREQNVTKIDLLKIDVEKSEWHVLQGIDEEHWPLIQQVVLEVHDTNQMLAKIETLLKDRGFHVVSDQDTLLKNTNLYNIYAVREPAPVEPAPQLPVITTQLFNLESISQQLAKRLPAYMLPNLYHVLNKMPLNQNGKIARDDLSLEGGIAAVSKSLNKPKTPMEEMVLDIFHHILPGGMQDVDGDFFAYGGHSLLATQVISRVREHFGVELPLRSLFDAPTPASFAKAVETARSEEAGTTQAPIGKTDPQAAHPLSLSQRRLWVLQQLEPDSQAYQVPFAFALEGQLNTAALHLSLNTIVERHHVLRSVFPKDQTPPTQQVAPHRLQPLKLEDISHLTGSEQEQALQAIQSKELSTPFNLQTPPLMRWQFVMLAPNKHVVLLTLHHIVSDGWSMGILVNEIAALYQAYLEQKPNPLPDLERQYADYAAWQHQQLETPAMAAQVDYWQTQLHQSPAETVLPHDCPRKDRQTHAGKTLKYTLDADHLQQLKQISQNHHATLFMVLLAAFKSVLHRHTGQKDLAVGTVIAGRNHADLEPLIGYFLNNLTIRSSCEPDQSFQDFLQKVSQTTLDAYTHQDLPFEHILSVLDVPRDLAMTPLFQTLFIHQNAPVGQLELPHLQLKPMTSAQHTAKFDLTIMTMETENGLGIHFNFNTDLYTSQTMDAYAQQFLHLLRTLDSQQHKPLEKLSFVTPTPAKTVASPLLGSNAAAETVPSLTSFESVGACFEDVAKRFPSRPALTDGTTVMTFAELDQAANRVANHLNLPADTVVGLLFSNETAMVVSFLGAIKAGLVAVPLDPSHPPARLNAIFQDSGALHLITCAKHQGVASTIPADQVTVHSYETAQTASQQPLPQSNRQSCPLYLLYTSGSTGVPKGVIQTHANTLFFMQRYIENLGIESTDHLSMLSSFTFDAGLMDLFGALLSGGQLCLFNVRERGLADLATWLQQQQITILHMVPTLYRHFLQSLTTNQQLERVRLVVLGGEAAKADDLDLFNHHFSSESYLVNGFGPTESTLALQAFFPSGSTVATAGLPLGQPIDGMQVLLTNSQGSVIEGAGRGELVLCSSHLAQGYHLQDTQTRAAFFYNEQGQWCYRTGDLALRDASGNLFHTGRKDFQVKIRGHRVEIGDIEAACQALPGVQDAVVHVHQQEDVDSLCAYLIIDTKEPPNPAAARKHLTQSLPQYMIPEHFMVLEKLPLTVTGKLNRKALPLPERQTSARGMVYVSPQTPTEKALADIWKELLKIDMLGIHDNFFSLGAHSLTAIQAILKIRDHFLIDLPLNHLFENPTIAGLAKALADMQSQDEDDDLMASLLDALENEDQGAS